MLQDLARGKASRTALLVAIVVMLLAAACGEDDASGTPSSPMATASNITVRGSEAGDSPFIAFVTLQGSHLENLQSVSFRIEPRPGTASRPVSARYAVDYLRQRGYLAGEDRIRVPVFGLYAAHDNRLALQFSFSDRSERTITTAIATRPHADPQGVLQNPVRHMARRPGSQLGFDFFLMKTAFAGPVVVDTDGFVRWALPGAMNAMSSIFTGREFVVGSADEAAVHRIGLDGVSTRATLAATGYRDFHHNIDPGRTALLAEVNTEAGGITEVMSTLVEMTPDGAVLKEWDIAAIFEAHMRAQGDDPARFVRRGRDWLHMNSAVHDARDDSLIVSSRENFLFKIDYDTGELRWILGDPGKYWHSFPSLRALAISVEDGDDPYPAGQHAPSLTADGLVMLFDNGLPSLNQPIGEPAGSGRPYSRVLAYEIDEMDRTARRAWSFDYGKGLLSDVCSSVYEADDRSLLVTFSVTNQGANARLVGLDAAHEVVFDLEYENPNPVFPVSWNAIPVAFDGLELD